MSAPYAHYKLRVEPPTEPLLWCVLAATATSFLRCASHTRPHPPAPAVNFFRQLRDGTTWKPRKTSGVHAEPALRSACCSACVILTRRATHAGVKCASRPRYSPARCQVSCATPTTRNKCNRRPGVSSDSLSFSSKPCKSWGAFRIARGGASHLVVREARDAMRLLLVARRISSPPLGFELSSGVPRTVSKFGDEDAYEYLVLFSQCVSTHHDRIYNA